MKRVKSAGKVPISKSAVRQKMQISKTPKLKVKNESRRRITKIKEFSNQLSKVNEASQEESIKSIVDSKGNSQSICWIQSFYSEASLIWRLLSS